MAQVQVPAILDPSAIAAIDIPHPATPTYVAPRLFSLGKGAALIRGGGGMSGNDCRYDYYYTTGPYGC